MGVFCGQNFEREYIDVLLKCHYDQIRDIHFFTFSYTIGLS